MVPGIDETNLRLLHLLQKNGRATIAELARELGRSESVIRDRLANLEAQGIVKGYRADIDWGRAGLPAHVMVQAKCPLDQVEFVRQQLSRIPNVTSADLVTGSKPVVAHLQVRDVEHLRDVLHDHFASAGLLDTEASIVIDRLVHHRAPEIPDRPPGGWGK